MTKFTESLKLTNVNDVISSILIGNVGEKVPQELKDYASTEDIKDNINGYYVLADDKGLDKSKVMQMAIKIACHSEDPIDSFKRWSSRELVPNIIKYSSSDWLKDYDLYKALSEKGKKLNLHELENLRAFIRDESLKHGKATKGSGKKNNDVELLYKDENWILLTPKSWDAEKKIAYFTNDNGEKEKCHWCTAAGDSDTWYNTYTYNNTKPLYVMINKDDKAWQLAYYPSGHRVEFLNSYDQSDNFTEGDWMDKLPKEMMSKVINKFNGLSMLDFVERHDKVDDDKEFEVKFLPWVKIIGHNPSVSDDFNQFMMGESNSSKIGDDVIDLCISIRTNPNCEVPFKITESGPMILDTIKLHSFTKLEQSFIRTALLQYTAECMNLDVDYMERFDKILSELKETFKK